MSSWLQLSARVKQRQCFAVCGGSVQHIGRGCMQSVSCWSIWQRSWVDDVDLQRAVHGGVCVYGRVDGGYGDAVCSGSVFACRSRNVHELQRWLRVWRGIDNADGISVSTRPVQRCGCVVMQCVCRWILLPSCRLDHADPAWAGVHGWLCVPGRVDEQHCGCMLCRLLLRGGHE